MVELEPDKRADRYIVDARDGAEVHRLNEAHRQAQKVVLTKLAIDGVQIETDDDE